MQLTAGQTLSIYEILGPLGAGAMGEVYRARDTRLGREVAIKLVPAELAGDTERLRRFEREARTLASLSHPNVAHVYGIDQVGDTCFMAMELVPGEDLAALLSRGAFPVDQALDVCAQIAEGVEAAHEAGVIHRDLKPANVVLTPEGRVKILDFGLAKSAPDAEPVLETEAGRLLGTPAYMAPEQARGKQIDRRVDVWAFGCVLYECLTGCQAFAGETLGDVMVAVLESEPDWAALPAATPAPVRALLGRCLDKDPRTRLRDLGEARILLRSGSAHREPQQPSTGRRGFLLPSALVVAALGMGALAGWGWVRAPVPSSGGAQPLRRLTSLAGVEEMPAVSPDEKYLAFVARVNGRRQIFRRLMAEGGTADAITAGDADHAFPRWVDGDTLLYFRHGTGEGEEGELWRTLVVGSTPRKVAGAQGEADVSHSGRTLATFRTDGEGPALILVDLDGPEHERRIPLSTGIYRTPRWSPDDRFLAFEVFFSLGESEIRVLDLAREEARTVVTAGATRGLAWLPDGSGLVYSSSHGSTMAYPPIFSLRAVRIDGSNDVSLGPTDVGYASYVEPEVTSSGRLIASRIRLESDIWMFPVGGTPPENVRNARRITQQTGLVQVPCVSPDGEEIAYLSDSGGHANIWVARIDGSEPPRPITFEQDPRTMIGLPEWSPRGDWIVYIRLPMDADNEECLVSPRGIPRPTPLARSPALGSASWSHDGEWLYYYAEVEAGGEQCTYRVRVDGGEPELVRRWAVGMEVAADGTGYFIHSKERPGRVFRAAPAGTGEAEPLGPDLASRIPLFPHEFALSPDGEWLATPLLDRGTTDLWLLATGDGHLRQVTDFQQRPTLICRQVSWARDSQHLFAALMEVDADVVLLPGALP